MITFKTSKGKEYTVSDIGLCSIKVGANEFKFNVDNIQTLHQPSFKDIIIEPRKV